LRTLLARVGLAAAVGALTGTVLVAPAVNAATIPVTIGMQSVSMGWVGEATNYASDVTAAGASSQPTGSVTFSVVEVNGKSASIQLCRAMLIQGPTDSGALCGHATTSSMKGDDKVMASYGGSATYAASSTTSMITFTSYALTGLVLPPRSISPAPNLPVRAPDPSWVLASGSTLSGGTAAVFVTAGGSGIIQEYGASFGPNGVDPIVTAGPMAANNSKTLGDGSPSVEPYTAGSTSGYVMAWSQIINSYYCVSFAFDDGTLDPITGAQFLTSSTASSVCAKKGVYPFASTGPSTSVLDPYLFSDSSGAMWLIFSAQWSGGTCTAVQCSELVAQQLSIPSTDTITLVGAPQALVSEVTVEAALNTDNPSTSRYTFGDHPLIENPAVIGPQTGTYDLVFSIGTWCGATTAPICGSTNGCGSSAGTDCNPAAYNTAEVSCTIADGATPTWACDTATLKASSPTVIMRATGGASFLAYRMAPSTLMIWDEWIASSGGGAPYSRQGYESTVTYSNAT
jgi:hypothetical protein